MGRVFHNVLGKPPLLLLLASLNACPCLKQRNIFPSARESSRFPASGKIWDTVTENSDKNSNAEKVMEKLILYLEMGFVGNDGGNFSKF